MTFTSTPPPLSLTSAANSSSLKRRKPGGNTPPFALTSWSPWVAPRRRIRSLSMADQPLLMSSHSDPFIPHTSTAMKMMNQHNHVDKKTHASSSASGLDVDDSESAGGSTDDGSTVPFASPHHHPPKRVRHASEASFAFNGPNSPPTITTTTTLNSTTSTIPPRSSSSSSTSFHSPTPNLLLSNNNNNNNTFSWHDFSAHQAMMQQLQQVPIQLSFGWQDFPLVTSREDHLHHQEAVKSPTTFLSPSDWTGQPPRCGTTWPPSMRDPVGVVEVSSDSSSNSSGSSSSSSSSSFSSSDEEEDEDDSGSEWESELEMAETTRRGPAPAPSSPMLAPSRTSPLRCTRHVRFSHVLVQTHALTLGDHPWSTCYPLSLDWPHTEPVSLSIDAYESQQQQRRRRPPSRRPASPPDANQSTTTTTDRPPHALLPRRWSMAERKLLLVKVTGISTMALQQQETERRLQALRQLEQGLGPKERSPVAVYPGLEMQQDEHEEEEEEDPEKVERATERALPWVPSLHPPAHPWRRGSDHPYSIHRTMSFAHF